MTYVVRTIHDCYDLLRFLDACIWADLQSNQRDWMLRIAMHECARRVADAYNRRDIDAQSKMHKASNILENTAINLKRGTANDNLAWMCAQLSYEVGGAIAAMREPGFVFVPFSVQVPQDWPLHSEELPLALHFRMEDCEKYS